MSRARKIYSKDDILRSMRYTKSILAASRYLGCTYNHAKSYFKMFTDESTGKTLFEIHKNREGKGILKHITRQNKKPNLESILNGGFDFRSWSAEAIKMSLIIEGYLAEECALCNFNERRVSDYKVPLLLNFKNGNKNHYIFSNLELLCYNCYFLRVGDIFNRNQNLIKSDQIDNTLKNLEEKQYILDKKEEEINLIKPEEINLTDFEENMKLLNINF